jgi:hypothetical protein
VFIWNLIQTVKKEEELTALKHSSERDHQLRSCITTKKQS